MLVKHLRQYAAFRTDGRIVVDDVEIAKTIEDIGRGDGIKVDYETCLAEGLYKVKISHSPAFNRDMILLYTNPDDYSCELGNIRFTGIRVHFGTKTSNTEGCVCVTNWAALEALFNMIKSALAMGEEVLWEIGRDDPPVSLAA